jgi:RNA ligase (TIGR02306 family)
MTEFANSEYFTASIEADRPLAIVATIRTISPIEGADRIELATFESLGWQCAVPKGEFKAGDRGIYFAIDSVLDPTNTHFAFQQGKRIKTKKMCGELSQGLFLGFQCLPYDITLSASLCDDNDFSAALKVRKYIPKEEAAENAGDGPNGKAFPWFVPKTREDRVQEIPRVLRELPGKEVVITRKEDGTSTTAVFVKATETKTEEFFLCGRNHMLEESDKTATHYFAMEKKYAIGAKMKQLGRSLAIQAETVGPKINNNKMKLKELEFEVFNIYDIDERCYLQWEEVESICQKLGLNTVPVVYRGQFPKEWASGNFLLNMAETLEYSKGICAEGMVCKTNYGKGHPRSSFKVISNKFLLKHGK